MIKDSLGDRMKSYYEETTKTRLLRRVPVIIRLDGCHFHTVTRGFKKPFDEIMIKTMQDTMKYLCENIRVCLCRAVIQNASSGISSPLTWVRREYRECVR